MTDEEYDSRLEIISELAARFPSAELTDQNVKGYIWSLSDLSLPILRAAIDRCINTCKFFPVVADIREAAGATSTGKDDERHSDNCKCLGTGMYVPEGRDADGYKLGALRCDGVPVEPIEDPDDVSMF